MTTNLEKKEIIQINLKIEIEKPEKGVASQLIFLHNKNSYIIKNLETNLKL